MVSTTWFKDFDLVVGARSERFSQSVNTFDTSSGDPIDSEQDTHNLLPSVLATYRLPLGFQLRVALAETVNRPSMLELSQSVWVDPVSGDLSIGNPRLKEANISHFDGRLEWYGAGANSISLAFFSKDFTNPIERTLKTSSGAGELVTYKNAKSASNSGIEMDFRYDLDFVNTGSTAFMVSGNYSIIESDVVLPEGHTEYSDTRAMQGQSPYTMNAMLSMDYDTWGLETAFILNEIGERITKVGQGSVPHVFEQPFTALDFTLSQSISEGKLSFKLKNLLAEKRLFTQGGEVYQTADPGISFSVSYSHSF
jgi:outer membrane receptor protein involved in Fe transport